jgi:hypothetical protein
MCDTLILPTTSDIYSKQGLNDVLLHCLQGINVADHYRMISWQHIGRNAPEWPVPSTFRGHANQTFKQHHAAAILFRLLCTLLRANSCNACLRSHNVPWFAEK